ncbi:hypothetical protein R3P38DRAFT_3216286 [Favolaschia claudopus]|uniref:Uncharacterized protein n=1 Tax=Favolaschia claudopus TaxID=2862362 RepID=A0AAW0A6S2_9AGAR
MAICICAEQTFSEGSAKSQGFVPAFEDAMEHYVGSELEKHALHEYHKSLPASSDRYEGRGILKDIILNHPLRGYPVLTCVSHHHVCPGIGPAAQAAENWLTSD